MWDYQHAFELHPRLQDATVKWIPAHKTFQEAVEGGMSYEDGRERHGGQHCQVGSA